MDLRLRTREREFSLDPSDPERVAALRASLAHADLASARALFDRWIGGYYAASSWENEQTREQAYLRFTGAGLLPPLAPSEPRLRWEREGRLVGVNHHAVLLEGPLGDLYALDPETGRELWRAESLGGGPVDPREGRRERLGWALAPWGAVELTADFEAEVTYRRRGRYHATLGRVTERVADDRLDAGGHVRLQVLRPERGWREAPSRLLEQAPPSFTLCEGELELPTWDDSLYELELDLHTASFVVRTLEQERGQGHAFVVREARIDAVPWSLEADDDVPEPLDEVLEQRVSRGEGEWVLAPEGQLSAPTGDAWRLPSGGGCDLIAYAGEAWVLGPEATISVFAPGQAPRRIALEEVFEGRCVGRQDGVVGFGLERGLLLQRGPDSICWLA